MKKILFLFLFLINFFLFGNSKRIILGKVIKIKGKAFYQILNQKRRKPLKKNQKLYRGMIIITLKKSSVLIKLSNGIKRWVLPQSKLYIVNSKKDVKVLKELKNMLSVGGLKADEKINTGFIEEEDEIMKKLSKIYHQKKYDLFIIKSMKYLKRIKKPEFFYSLANAFFQTGYYEKALNYFSLVNRGKNEDLAQSSIGGMVLCYYQLDQKIKAKRMLLEFSISHPFYKKLEELLEKE